MGTAHVLVVILARSPEFSKQDGFRNRSQAGVGRDWGLGRTVQFCTEFLRNLRNPPGFQEPVRKEVTVTQGRKIRVTQRRWPGCLPHIDCVLAALVLGLLRGKNKAPESFSILLPVIFLEEGVSTVIVEAILAVGSWSSTRTVAYYMLAALGAQSSVPGLHLLGIRLGRPKSISRDAGIFHRQKRVTRGLRVGLGVPVHGVLRADVV